jgi:hypothetical protein
VTGTTDHPFEVLVGKPLTGSRRALDMEMFGFGEQTPSVNRRGHTYLRSEYYVHVQCFWRIRRGRKVVVNYFDMLKPPLGVPSRGFDPEGHKSLRDELLAAFYAERVAEPRIVAATTMTATGDARLTFDDDSVMELLPSRDAPVNEYWRLLLPGGTHVVMERTGLDTVAPNPPATR